MLQFCSKWRSTTPPGHVSICFLTGMITGIRTSLKSWIIIKIASEIFRTQNKSHIIWVMSVFNPFITETGCTHTSYGTTIWLYYQLLAPPIASLRPRNHRYSCPPNSSHGWYQQVKDLIRSLIVIGLSAGTSVLLRGQDPGGEVLPLFATKVCTHQWFSMRSHSWLFSEQSFLCAQLPAKKNK